MYGYTFSNELIPKLECHAVCKKLRKKLNIGNFVQCLMSIFQIFTRVRDLEEPQRCVTFYAGQ